MLDPRTVLLVVPSYSGSNVSELTGALIRGAGLYGAFSTPTECSHVSLTRNLIAANFLANPQFQWLVSIDNDTVPTQGDLELLLEPIDEQARYLCPDEAETDEDGERFSPNRGYHPLPTRVLVPQWTDHAHRLSGRPQVELPADALVMSEYSYKNDTLQPVKLGMGFVRIHRLVFETLMELKHDGGPTVEVQRHRLEEIKQAVKPGADFNPVALIEMCQHLIDTAEDKAGQPRLWQSSFQGRTFYDFFPSGPLISQFVPTGEWKGEDHGFVTLCMLAGIIPRIETRTRLVHIGRKGYPYFGPDTGGGQ